MKEIAPVIVPLGTPRLVEAGGEKLEPNDV